MSARRRYSSSPPRKPATLETRAGADVTPAIDWPAWLRTIERKRRLFRRRRSPVAVSAAVVERFTFVSFKLQGILLDEQEVAAARRRGPGVFRPRSAQRIRNHLSILHRIERLLRRAEALKSSTVVRWYTLISAGLSTTMLADGKMDRLDHVVRRVNSPHLRLQPALNEIVRLHLDVLRDELVPGFSGILARLLLCYHLGRCALPPVLLDPDKDDLSAIPESAALARLLELIDDTYTLLLRVPIPKPPGTSHH